jgi:hypothetical protein
MNIFLRYVLYTFYLSIYINLQKFVIVLSRDMIWSININSYFLLYIEILCLYG